MKHSISPRAEQAVAQLTDAAAQLRANAGAHAVPLSLALHIEAYAEFWRQWFPADPTDLDKSVLHIARAVAATYPPQTPAADPGDDQHTPKKEELDE